ncbi:MAG: ABC transporter permease [Actinobacteria bacterium]|nr:ABC transporter permease [Actinomycetota bacterium]MCL6088222.1 ABC transporter permease [Actinomycetota bacterium]
MKNKSLNFLKIQTNLVILVLLVIILSITVPSFRQVSNFLNILKSISVISIISCGMTLVVIGGGLDLSVGSTFSLAAVISIVMINKNSVVLAIIVPIIAAIIIGILNGAITSYFNISSIIVTLGMLSVVGGFALFYVNGGTQVANPNKIFESIAKINLFKIPLYCYIFIIIAIIYEILLKRTTFGRNLILIGTNPEAAKIIGINITLTRSLSFIICSVSVAIAAILLSSRLMTAAPTAGVGYEFDVITAIVIGGISLSGGKGNIYNTVIGAILLGVVINALTLTNVPFAFQAITKGFLIILAITLDVRARSSFEN